jgi:sigma-B regulation protein RsbU (phosphoserine phosphatase)
MGMMPGVEFPASEVPVPVGSRLYLYTDGCHEIHLPAGGLWPFDDFVAFMSQPTPPSISIMDSLLDHVRRLSGTGVLHDDFSIVEARF